MGGPRIIDPPLHARYYIGLEVPDSPKMSCVARCTTYNRYLCGQWRENPNVFPFPVTDILVRALAVHVGSELGDVDQDLLEMVDFCEARLDSDISTESLVLPFLPLWELFFVSNDPSRGKLFKRMSLVVYERYICA